jgi:hypothetical protein
MMPFGTFMSDEQGGGAVWNTWALLGVLDQEVIQVTTPEIAPIGPRSHQEPGAPSVVCYAGSWKKATSAAQVVADLERRSVYVLKGYRPNRRGFRSPVYYVSRDETFEVCVEGLPSREVVGPPYSSPRLLRVVSPRDLQ